MNKPDQISFRAANREDGANLWRLVQSAGTLELNSAYFYLLLANDFGDSCLVAERGDRIVGTVIGYRPPRDPETAFVWQIGLAPNMQGQGLGTRMLSEWLNLAGNRDARWLTATVAEDNEPSRRLFTGFARHLGVDCDISEHFTTAMFPDPHPAEQLFRIGPLPPPTRTGDA
ncbi:diaminobutyrate acetyltransferase [Rhodocyclaceae bacterium SMB388]